MAGPTAIGRYRVTGLLGTGAFSAVYRAVDDRIGGEVAVKLLADHHSLDPDIRERFIAEARLLRRLTSPHVVRLYELDETEAHQPFHVLEYVRGGNLAAHRAAGLAAGRTVTMADVLAVAADLTTALEVLHAERIVHRDLAPKNLLVRPAVGAGGGVETFGPEVGEPEIGEPGIGEPEAAGRGIVGRGEQLVLADLGISKDLADSSGLTAAAGTLGYAAPEQRIVGVIDERVDVYAASAVLVWLVSGRRPSEVDADAVVAAGFPAALAAVIGDGLAVDPAARPPSIDAWHAAVRRALDADRPTALPPPVGSAAGFSAGGAALGLPQPPGGSAGTSAGAPATTPARSSPRWRVVVPTVVAVAIAAGGSGYGLAQLADDDPPAMESVTTELDDDTVRAEQTVGAVTAAFTGPTALRVGERATFSADVAGTADWVWVASTGDKIADRSSINLTPSSAGTLTLQLVAVGAGPDGDVATARATFTVTDPDA